MFGIGVAALGVVLLGVYLRFIRPWQLRWGATDEEVARAMSGDDVVKQPTFNATRAVTIQARPEEIWPWLVQIGVTRAGWIILASPAPSASSPNSSRWQSATWYRSVQMESKACGSRRLNRISGCSGGTTKARLPGTGGSTRRMTARHA
jgi:hypothetical protein